MLVTHTEPRNAELQLTQDISRFAEEAISQTNARPIVRLFATPTKDFYWDATLKNAWERHLAATLPKAHACWRIRKEGIEVAIFPSGASLGERCDLRRGHWQGVGHLKTDRVCSVFARVWRREPMAAQAPKPSLVSVAQDKAQQERREQIARNFAHAVKNLIKPWLTEGVGQVSIGLLPADPLAVGYSEQAVYNREIAEYAVERLRESGIRCSLDERSPYRVPGRTQHIHNLRSGIYFEDGLVRDYRLVRFTLRMTLSENEGVDKHLAEDAANHVMQRLLAWLEEDSTLAVVDLPILQMRQMPLHDHEAFAELYKREVAERLSEANAELHHGGAYSEQIKLLNRQLPEFIRQHKLKSWAIVDEKVYVYRTR